jgi:hypothetical protein
MNLLLTTVIATLTFVLGLLASSLRSYVSKKGENLATKEDVAELTRITKSIEARISEDTWARQRGWELKKEAAFETLKELGSLQWRLPVFAALSRGRYQGLDGGPQEKVQQEYEECGKCLNESVNALGRVMMLTRVTCGPEVKTTINIAHDTLLNLCSLAATGDLNEAKIKAELAKSFSAIDAVAEAIWTDLESSSGPCRLLKVLCLGQTRDYPRDYQSSLH